MGRLKEARPEADPPALLLVPSERLEALAAEQEAGQCYYGECIFPPAKRQRLAEPSFLLYTNQQFQEHLGAQSICGLFGGVALSRLGQCSAYPAAIPKNVVPGRSQPKHSPGGPRRL